MEAKMMIAGAAGFALIAGETIVILDEHHGGAYPEELAVVRPLRDSPGPHPEMPFPESPVFAPVTAVSTATAMTVSTTSVDGFGVFYENFG
jgi:hypothetical protein